MFSRLASPTLLSAFNHTLKRSFGARSLKPPVRVAVTGAAGQIGYATLFRIASGEMLGLDQPIILQCLEMPNAVPMLEAIAMELDDCAFPLLKKVICTSDVNRAFDGIEYALLIGAKPRTKGMERADLLKDNGAIFVGQGKALNANANREKVKVVVTGNPANTNALIASSNAPDINPRQFSALTQLDHNRGLAQLAIKGRFNVDDIDQFAIWGNHSPTMYPDTSHTVVNGVPLSEYINDQAWIRDTFIPTIQQRGAAVIKARGGTSSAASAANATLEHMRNWAKGTNGRWASMGVFSEGDYGVPKGIYFSFPLIIDSNGKYEIVKGLQVDEFGKKKLDVTIQELQGEAATVAPLSNK